MCASPPARGLFQTGLMVDNAWHSYARYIHAVDRCTHREVALAILVGTRSRETSKLIQFISCCRLSSGGSPAAFLQYDCERNIIRAFQITQAWHQPAFTRLRPCLCVHADWSASLVRGSARICELAGLTLGCLIVKYQSHHCAVSAGQACRRCGCQAHKVVNVVVPAGAPVKQVLRSF